ncbi:hypothetical protein F5J12DRAFT_1723 [Pisolithus orientalis]|uniref:uncharacterized protein n=1 Tax=Pisolithus orientalis TaxID=936130 RepID=UPI0022257D82|nr:uncharacterized protein F5J12DRAFT_1723 [Pisolithus orientalis]KAI6034856.1 hypothetical protein F5J12DRAFT_1723 [Pisolithus orientalis]
MQQQVCQYYLRGACKFGDRCKNEHPRAPLKPQFGNQSWAANSNANKALLFTTESLTNDVTPLNEKPLWPLSSYGAAKHEKTLISGLDESPEELRVKAVAAVKAGTTNEYVKYEADKMATADQIYATARDNIPQLHSRASELSQNIPSSVFGSSSAFGTLSNQPTMGPKPGTSAFGQSGFGNVPAGPSAFGQAAQTSSAFGTTQPTSVFGQPSQTQSAFSQPTSAFGQTSAFRQVQPTSAFGQPSLATSAFGQAPKSAFGQSPQTTSAFDQAQSTPAFGQSSLIKPGSGAFGSTTANSSPFGGGGFSAFSAQPSGFAAATPATGSVFGQATFPSTAQTTQPQSAFAPAAPSQPASAFAPSSTSVFGYTSSTLPVPSPVSAFPAAGLMAPSPTTSGTGKPSSGTPDFALAKSRVHCKPESDRFLPLLPPNYFDIIPPEVRAAFESDRFEWGKIPEWIPPKEVR